MHTAEGVHERVWRLILERSKERDQPAPTTRPGLEDNLFEDGLIDAAGMIKLVELVDELVGSGIDFREVDPEEFFTLRGIGRYVVTRQTDRTKKS